MQAITLEIILRTVFGVEDRGQMERLGAPLQRLLNSTDHPARLLALQFTKSEGARPRSPWGRIYGLMAPADEMVYEEIRAHRNDPHADERDDILSLLLAARDEDGNGLTDRELRDELMTLLVAGHETTATALAWTLERLVRNPARARAPARRAGGGRQRVPRGDAEGDAAPAARRAGRDPAPAAPA